MTHTLELLVSSSPALVVKEENSTADEVGEQTGQSNTLRQGSDIDTLQIKQAWYVDIRRPKIDIAYHLRDISVGQECQTTREDVLSLSSKGCRTSRGSPSSSRALWRSHPPPSR